MATFGSFDAKARLSELIERASKGERVTITKHGTPVAMLVAAEPRRSKDRKQVIAELKAFGKGRSLQRGTTLRDLIEEGRRF